MTTKHSSPLRIGIVGGGFSGTALAANFYRLSNVPIEIFLFEKTGKFGTGDAYRTPYAFHLLNVRSKDMSAFEDEPAHFLNWLHQESHAIKLKTAKPIAEQFVPRMLYRHYLNSLLEQIVADDHALVKLHLDPYEIINCEVTANHAPVLITSNGRRVCVDKVILALGNNPPAQFPFPVDDSVRCLDNPWDYTNVKAIDASENVLIVGTGLSMIDAVLSLHDQNHRGKIIALSRHGVMPLPHADNHESYFFSHVPFELSMLLRHVRQTAKSHMTKAGDWRTIVHALRPMTGEIWQNFSLADKKRFLRHLAVYWNIHRHRVDTDLFNLVQSLKSKGQLSLLSGRVLHVKNKMAIIKERHANIERQWPITTIINCMGPANNVDAKRQPFLHSLLAKGVAALDPLNLGLEATANGEIISQTGTVSEQYYALGPLIRGMTWESSAVPEIRKQSFALVNYILQQQ